MMFDWFKIKKEEIEENERLATVLIALAEKTFEEEVEDGPTN